MSEPVSALPLAQRIRSVRGHKVMLDTDLAELYRVTTKALLQSVKRNPSRFPQDFMFLLTKQEAANLRSQIVTSSLQLRNWGGRRHGSYAFTEQGVAMLSSVLRSERAVQVNVEIMRAFVRLRDLIGHDREMSRRLDDLESKYDRQFKVVFDAIRELMAPPAPALKRKIGFVSAD
ncbi:MAG TPA: ORF6N domain-containing protein [Burkholderiales bacterium]|nr:ORF6N domain-containing protein [Burkholderiales bacterium]